jgi:hypothetical protein
MTEKIEPALTAEEWSGAIGSGGTVVLPASGKLEMQGDRATCECCGCFDVARYAVAALALYGQPFGFTREDASRIRGAAEFAVEMSGGRANAGAVAKLHNIADRIEALLPAEKK